MLRSILSVFLALMILFAFLTTSGCVPVYKRISNTPESINKSIRPGHIVKLTTKDRRDFKFKVVELNSQAISSKHEQILLSDIKSIKKKRRRFILFYILSAAH